ncbi:MAG: M48 family metallopeptidase [Puniceicoccales bacterium]|jgi:Zn-dependent protease with chaperone function|nr:M48 family metallopeptidase [Puniceicoccales bacterium]
MNFFAAQQRARVKTRRLIVLFIAAVLAIAAVIYLVIALALDGGAITGGGGGGGAGGVGGGTGAADLSRLWMPEVALWTLLGVSAVVGLGSLYKWSSLSAGGSAVANAMGGVRVTPRNAGPLEKRLLNVVEEMALASGVPVPAAYVLPHEPAINAFAAGLTTGDAVVAVSRGALEQLTRDELQAVVGHEFSHILNGDMRLNLKITAVVFGILMFTVVGRVLLEFGARGGRSRSKDGNAGAVMLAAGLGLLVLGWVGYFFGRVIQSAVSRQREFLADASSVQFTRNPQAMAGALQKILRAQNGSVLESPHATEFSHLFFATGVSGFLASLFATHPPLEARIRAVLGNREWGAGSGERGGSAAATPLTTGAGGAAQVGALGFAGRGSGTAGAAGFTAGSVSETGSGRAGDVHAAPSPAVSGTAAALPPHFPLSEAAREPSTAGGVLLDLLREPPPPAVAALDPAHRVPLAQISIGAIGALPPAEQDALVAEAQRLVDADGRVSVFEYALMRLLRWHVESVRDPRRAARVSMPSTSAFADACSVLLSFVTYAGRSRTLAPDAIFAAGAAALTGVARKPPALLPPAQCSFRRLDAALELLAHTPPLAKGAALNAVTAAAHADGEIHPDEDALLRVLAAALE